MNDAPISRRRFALRGLAAAVASIATTQLVAAKPQIVPRSLGVYAPVLGAFQHLHVPGRDGKLVVFDLGVPTNAIALHLRATNVGDQAIYVHSLINQRETGLYVRPGDTDAGTLAISPSFGGVVWLTKADGSFATPFDIFVRVLGHYLPLEEFVS